jgi:hypothetical protein
MNNKDQAVLFMRTLDDIQLRVLIILMIDRGGLTMDEMLFRANKKDRKLMDRACAQLSTPPYCMIVKQPGQHNKFVWMPTDALLPFTKSLYFGGAGDPVFPLRENWKESELKNLRATTTILDNLIDVKDISSSSRDFPLKENWNPEPDHENPNYDACLRACRKVGIGEPAAGFISDLRNPDNGEWMTPGLIIKHKENLKPGVSIRLAIHRLKQFEMIENTTRPEPLRGRAVTDEFSKYFPGRVDQDEEEEVYP